MQPVHQRFFGGDTGDCLLACIATITGIPLGEIPHNNDMGELKQFLHARGWLYFECEMGHYWRRQFQGIPFIASVPSKKLQDTEHALVVTMRGSTLTQLHDPNPNNSPYNLQEVSPTNFGILVRVDGLPPVVPA